MTSLDEYAHRYESIRMERRDGILQVTLHTHGGPLRWGLGPQGELVRALVDIGADRGNRVIILTGTGDEFSGPHQDPTGRYTTWAASRSPRRASTACTGTRSA